MLFSLLFFSLVLMCACISNSPRFWALLVHISLAVSLVSSTHLSCGLPLSLVHGLYVSFVWFIVVLSHCVAAESLTEWRLYAFIQIHSFLFRLLQTYIQYYSFHPPLCLRNFVHIWSKSEHEKRQDILFEYSTIWSSIFWFFRILHAFLKA